MNTCQHCRFYDDSASIDKEVYGDCHLNPPLVFLVENELRKAVRPETTPDSVACGYYQQRPVPAWGGSFSFNSKAAVTADDQVVGE